MVTDPLFLAYLAQFDDDAWLRAVDRLEGAIHPVDRAATRGWFHFFPLRLQEALETSSEPEALAGHLRLQGRWRLADQRESSHWFLFGHRFWADVRAAVARSGATSGAPGSLDLAAQVQGIAKDVATERRIDPSWVVGITAVALRTLRQVGLPAVTEEALSNGPFIGGARDQPGPARGTSAPTAPPLARIPEGPAPTVGHHLRRASARSIVPLDRLAAPDHCRRPRQARLPA